MFLVFIVWPALAFMWSLLNYRTSIAKRIVFAFIVLYGYTFIVNKDYDSDRYVQYFESTVNLNFSDFWNNLSNIYNDQSTLDILRPTLSFIVSRVSSNPQFLFTAFALVFGYFYLGSINRIYSLKENILPNFNASLFIFYLAVIIPISEINGFRFWTASWVFFYGIINYMLSSDKRFLLVALSASLVHFSFLSASVVLIIYIIVGNRELLYLGLVALSIIVPDLLSQYILVSPGDFGGGIETKVTQYTNETYVLQTREIDQKSAWFITWAHPMMKGLFLFSLAWLRIFRKSFISSPIQKNLFSFTLLFYAFVNFMNVMPSGGRFQQLFYLLAVSNIILFFLSHKTRKWHFLTICSIAPFALWVLIKFRILAVSTDLLLFSPMPILLASPSYSVLEFMQGLGVL